MIGTPSKATGSSSRARSKSSGAKLTDDELTQMNGNREQLEGKLQAKYGHAKDKAKQEVDARCNRTK